MVKKKLVPVKRQVPDKKEKPLLNEAQIKIRLKGCYGCPDNISVRVTQVVSYSLQPCFDIKVQCTVLGKQWVNPCKTKNHADCTRREHVARKPRKPPVQQKS